MRPQARAWLRVNSFRTIEHADRWWALDRILDAQVSDGPLKGSDLRTFVDWIAEANERHANDEAMIAQWAHRTWLDLANIRPDRILEGMMTE